MWARERGVGVCGMERRRHSEDETSTDMYDLGVIERVSNERETKHFAFRFALPHLSWENQRDATELLMRASRDSVQAVPGSSACCAR